MWKHEQVDEDMEEEPDEVLELTSINLCMFSSRSDLYGVNTDVILIIVYTDY